MAPRSDTAIDARDVQPSCPGSGTNVVKDVAKAKINLSKIRQLIPVECFEKNLGRSLYYMVRDIAFLVALQYIYPQYVAGNWPLTVIWWNINGLILWALFVVGHDCGHSTFSRYHWINDLCGHICHAPLMVPFWPWAKSHAEHHKYNNHVHKDMSHPWFGKKQFEETTSTLFKWWLKTPFHPLMSYLVGYLILGYYDGCHYYPFSALFWTRKEQLECAVSTGSVVMFVYGVVVFFDYAWMEIIVRYFIPMLVMNYWLYMVTYLQHHDEDVDTYDDSDYHFVTAALQTVDRTYGWGIDGLHHNITDCHVVHHLFYTKIPHYNLKKATTAIRPYLEEHGLYRYCYNPDFLWVFLRHNYHQGFVSHSKAAHTGARFNYLDKTRVPGYRGKKGKVL